MNSDGYVQRKKRIVIGVFNYVVNVILSNDPNTARAKLSRVLGEWEQDDCLAALHVGSAEGPISYVFLPFEADIGLVVHESCHAFWRMMEFIGAKHEDEVMAYTIAYITRETCKFIAKTGDPEKIITESVVSDSAIPRHVSNSLTPVQTFNTLDQLSTQRRKYLKGLYDQIHENSRNVGYAWAA